jgi:hypothetical protein
MIVKGDYYNAQQIIIIQHYNDFFDAKSGHGDQSLYHCDNKVLFHDVMKKVDNITKLKKTLTLAPKKMFIQSERHLVKKRS